MVLHKTFYASKIQQVDANTFVVEDGVYKIPYPRPDGLKVGNYRVSERHSEQAIFVSKKKIDMEYEEADSY